MKSTVLFVPGLRDHVADHWQTLLASELRGSRTVPHLEQDKLSLAARVMALDEAVREIEGPVILAAHSAGCLIVAHWARQISRPIRAALLATPPDIGTPLPPGYPTKTDLETNGWLPVPRARLPFRSLVAYSDNDPLARADRIVELARDWASDVEPLGDVGHLNPATGFGAWPQGKRLLEVLDSAPLTRTW